jgi:hypothetical protein
MRSLAVPVLAAFALSAAPAAALDLVGTWHVLVHFKDSATTHPERERWEDRVWEFAMEGDRLRWSDYPIVVFSDETGRFEQDGGNRASRVLHFWEPNEAQLAQIRGGLEINHRGSRTKTLRRAPDGGWTSGEGRPAYQSARFITFTELWSITGSPDRPVFSFDDVMGSATPKSFEGRTVYETESVEAGGQALRGRFERDGTRIGAFHMRRAGAAGAVKGSGKTDGQRTMEMFASFAGLQLFADQLPGGGSEQALRAALAAGEFGHDERVALRVETERMLSEAWQAQGNDPRRSRREIQSLARKITDLLVDEGKSVEEIQQMLGSGQILP